MISAAPEDIEITIQSLSLLQVIKSMNEHRLLRHSRDRVLREKDMSSDRFVNSDCKRMVSLKFVLYSKPFLREHPGFARCFI
jgi:hypothetical protein